MSVYMKNILRKEPFKAFRERRIPYMETMPLPENKDMHTIEVIFISEFSSILIPDYNKHVQVI